MTLTSSWIVRNWFWKNFGKNWKIGTKLTEKWTILICFDGFWCYSFKKSHPGYSIFNCSKIHLSVIHTKIITWINFQKMRWSHFAQKLSFRISLKHTVIFFFVEILKKKIQILIFILFVWYFGENYKRNSLIDSFINLDRKLSTHAPIYSDEMTLLRKKTQLMKWTSDRARIKNQTKDLKSSEINARKVKNN